MNICLAGDNRNRVNWGCRGTTAALDEIVGSHHPVTAYVSGGHTTTAQPHLVWSADSKRTVPEAKALYAGLTSVTRENKLVKAELQRHGLLYDFVSGWETNGLSFMGGSVEAGLKKFLEIYPHYPELKAMHDAIAGADALAINGEGTFIFPTPDRREALVYLVFIALALHLGKEVYFLNAMFSEAPTGGKTNRDLLRTAVSWLARCRKVVLRDPYSLELLRKHGGGENAVYVPDALFTWQERVEGLPPLANGDLTVPFPWGDKQLGACDFTAPYICVSGSSLAPRVPGVAKYFIRLVERIKSLGLRVYLVIPCVGDRFLGEVATRTGATLIPAEMPILAGAKLLSQARVYVSGRYHPSIMASLGGTPCVFLDSNSHKTNSLQMVMGNDRPVMYPITPNDEDIERIVEDCRRAISDEDGRTQRRELARRLSRECREGYAAIFAGPQEPAKP